MSLLSKRLQTSQSSDARGRAIAVRQDELPGASSPGLGAAAPTDESRPHAATRVNSLDMRMVRIESGEFWMGNRDSADELARAFPHYESERIVALYDEQPLHKVRITRPFYLGAHAVTVGQFARFVAESGYQSEAERDGSGGWGYRSEIAYFEGRKPDYSWRNPGFPQDERHPVVNVTWNDAVALCEWLSRRENLHYRLPSEAEWEFACRAGTTSRYHSGNDPEELVTVANLFDAACRPLFGQWEKFAVRASDGFAFTAPVGSLRPNSWGLYDMHGNVWEWCADWYADDYYRNSPVDDPAGPESGELARAPRRFVAQLAVVPAEFVPQLERPRHALRAAGHAPGHERRLNPCGRASACRVGRTPGPRAGD